MSGLAKNGNPGNRVSQGVEEVEQSFAEHVVVVAADHMARTRHVEVGGSGNQLEQFADSGITDDVGLGAPDQ